MCKRERERDETGDEKDDAKKTFLWAGSCKNRPMRNEEAGGEEAEETMLMLILEI